MNMKKSVLAVTVCLLIGIIIGAARYYFQALGVEDSSQYDSDFGVHPTTLQTTHSSAKPEVVPLPTMPAKPDQGQSLTKVTVLPDGRELRLRMPAVHPKSPPGVPLPESLYHDGKWDGQEETGVKILAPISTGLLLISGRYIPPPYRLVRVGACQFVNGELISYAYFWKKEAKAKSMEYVIKCLDDEQRLLWDMLRESSVVNLPLTYGLPSDNVWIHGVWEKRTGEIAEGTFHWGKMMVSAIPVAEKIRRSVKMAKVLATPNSIGPVCFRKMPEDQIRRLEQSDTDGFLRQLRVVVDRAAQIRLEKRKREEEQDRKAAEDHERYMQELMPQEPEDTNTITARHGFTYMGKDANGEDIWIPDPPRLDDKRHGVLLFADTHVLYRHWTDKYGHEYYPIEKWRSNGWWGSAKARPWWSNNSARGVGPFWYKLPWQEKTMSWRFKLGIEAILDNRWKVMLHNLSADPLTDVQAERIKEIQSLHVWPFYQARALIVVSKDSPLKRIAGPQLYDLSTSKSLPKFLRELGYRNVNVIYHSPRGDLVFSAASWMAKIPPGQYRAEDRDVAVIRDVNEFVAAIKKSPWNIGIILVQPDVSDLLAGLRILPVSRDGQQPYVVPSLDPIIQDEYPLTETLTFFCRDDAPAWANKIVGHFLTREFAERVWPEGIITEAMSRSYKGQLRLNTMKKGEGVRISAIGVSSGRRLMDDLATEYVKAKEVIQLRYTPREATVAMGYFVADAGGRKTGASGKQADAVHRGPELLVLDSPPAKGLLKAHGDKWDKLKPRQHCLGGRAVAIVVHRLNQLDALSLAQVRAVFAGKVKDWKHLAATGAETKPIRIRRLGLARPNATADLFYDKVLPPHVCGPMVRKKSVDEILAAMAMDPRSIAFVDLAALPPDADGPGGQGDGVLDGTSVKVLAIRPSGMDSAPVAPNARTIADGSYPLSHRLWLYVHPDASESAKGFAEFVGTCGHSEDSPYLETVRSVAETFRAHGAVPAVEDEPKNPCSPPAVESRSTAEETSDSASEDLTQ